MKRKLLFLMTLVISAFAFNAKAQTDVTATYIQDADFSSTAGWTQEHSNSTYWSLGNGKIGTYAVANNKTSTTDATHLSSEYCLGIQCRWQTNYADFAQEINLPAGVYVLSYDVQNTNASSKVTYENRFKVTVGSNNTYTDSSTEWMNGSSSWTTHSIQFTLSTASTVKISLGYGTGSNNIGSGSTPHLYVSHIKLTYTDPLQGAKQALLSEISKASACPASEGLASAIAAAQSVYDTATSVAELEQALADLQAADKDAVLRYDNNLSDASATNPLLTSFVVNGTFDSGISGWSRTGTYQNNKTANNQDGDFTGNFYENWNGSAQVNKMYQTINNIPNGTYKLKIAAFVNTLDDPNDSQFVFANADKTYLTTGGPIFYEVWTVVTGNTIEVGLEQIEAIANWMGIDNVSLTYYGAGDVIAQAQVAGHKINWDAALAAAIAARDNADYANVSGSERTNLLTEIGKAEPTTAEGYDAATAALISATSAFTAAKKNYDDLVNEIAKATALGIDTTAASATLNDANTTSADALATTQDLKVAEYTYVTSTFQYGVELGEWQSSGVNTGAAKFSNEHWSATTREYLNQDDSNGQGWNANSWSLDVYQDVELPAGNYVFKAAGRIAAGDGTTVSLQVKKGNDVLGSVNDFPHNGNNARGITTDGATQFADGYTYANGGQGFGWEWRYVKFSLSETSTVRVAINAVATKSHEWFSIGDYTVNTDNEAGFALIAYNVALAEAQAALANTDYANVAGAEKAAIESAVAADATLDKTNKAAIEAATQDLIDATTAFTAAKTDYDALAAAIAEAQAIDQTVNVGDGVFQIPATAVTALNTAISDAQSVGTNATDTANTAASAAIDLQSAVNNYYASVNGPTDGVKYTIHVATPGHSRLDYPIVVAQGATSANNPTGYTFRAEEATVNTAYPEAFTFTRESYNNYYISVEMPEGTVYLTCGTDNGSAAGWSDYQIQGTTDFSKARTFEIKASATQGAFNIVNKIVNKVITCQEGGSLYTDDATILPDFAVNVANQASVDLAIAADVQYATRIFPFVPTLPAGVVAYTCAEENGTLNLVEDSAPKANEPYILYAENGVASSTLTGWGMGKAATVTSGLLVGNFANDNLDVPENSYVLQKNNDKVAFYKVDNTVVGQVYVAQYRCYLTSGGSGAKVLNFNIDEATAIDAIEALTNGTAEIYNASGVRMNKLEKGMNIIRMSNGSVKKVLVK